MNADVQKTNRKAELLANTVEHVAIDQYDARPVIDAMRQMSFTSRDLARAALAVAGDGHLESVTVLIGGGLEEREQVEAAMALVWR